MNTWQSELQNCITTLDELATYLEIKDTTLLEKNNISTFPLKVPRPYLSRIKKGDVTDPLLRQILIQSEEFVSAPGFSADPLDEKSANQLPGLLHKYHGRVLVTLSKHCAIHCRYCFRRTFDYQNNIPGKKQLESIFNYLRNNQDIHEVILSGGDPLTVTDERIRYLCEHLQVIPHIKTLRIHTRLPVVIPSRITATLLNILKNCSLKIVMVLHINHPNEIDSTVKESCQQIKAHDIVLINQSVLLKGINDRQDILNYLSHQLFHAGILPYYLHLLDPVKGTHHFQVPADKAKQLYQEMIASLPGYLVPKLVQELSGKPAKSAVAT